MIFIFFYTSVKSHFAVTHMYLLRCNYSDKGWRLEKLWHSSDTIVLTIIVESHVYNVANPFAAHQIIKNDNGIRLKIHVACYGFCSISNHATLVSTSIKSSKNHDLLHEYALSLFGIYVNEILSTRRLLYCRSMIKHVTHIYTCVDVWWHFFIKTIIFVL